MGDKDAYRKILRRFYVNSKIKKKRLRLERKLREAGREIDEVFGKVSRVYIYNEPGSTELVICVPNNTFVINLKTNKLVYVSSGETIAGSEPKDLGELLRWILGRL
jgi:hypothetical protein